MLDFTEFFSDERFIEIILPRLKLYIKISSRVLILLIIGLKYYMGIITQNQSCNLFTFFTNPYKLRCDR